jgi:hypothetical protein
LLIIVADRLRRRAAAVKPPFSTTLTKAVMLAKRSMRLRLSSHNPIADYRARFEIPNFNWEGKQPFGKSSWTKGSTP